MTSSSAIAVPEEAEHFVTHGGAAPAQQKRFGARIQNCVLSVLLMLHM
jgi:hypothetical protein